MKREAIQFGVTTNKEVEGIPPRERRSRTIEGKDDHYESYDFVGAKIGTVLRINQDTVLVKTHESDSALGGWMELLEGDDAAVSVNVVVLEPTGASSSWLTGRVVLDKGDILGVAYDDDQSVIKEKGVVTSITETDFATYAQSREAIDDALRSVTT